ncbi:tRNA lysidine(34) synthetase TilS [Pararhodobacter zhoushanensis]|uniref:tRNA lysidine(34) synthetase TilS n=1 Tax=Pararhodobacter zhoushanensis TaxID=2479545 RepID=UPI000F8F4102|nr:tRNA lysidine(34) synthetase TilS [Pararhodobacter zhoushanensis]
MTGPAPLAVMRAGCEGFARLGVAVSGGGDSVAALVLAVEALGAARVAAVTVDHGLRPEAAAEAVGVAALCARLGVAHDVLRWSGPERGNLMDEARAARLALIGGWARGRVDAVVLAHTLDDQAETVLMRLARGSGVDGLSGMAERREAEGVIWLRPLLGVTREALRSELRARGVAWVDDPSNDNPRYQRVRARKALAALADLGIGAEGLAATAGRMRRARGALEAQAQAALDALVGEDRGTVIIDAGVRALEPEIRDRVVAHLLMQLSGATYRPRLEDLQRLLSAGQGTLMGCVLTVEGTGLRLSREAQAVAGLVCPSDQVWDHRWRAEGPVPGEIRALGEAGLLQLSQQARAGMHTHWRDTGLRRETLAALPGIWREGALIAAPLAFWPGEWRLSARPVAAIVTQRA